MFIKIIIILFFPLWWWILKPPQCVHIITILFGLILKILIKNRYILDRILINDNWVVNWRNILFSVYVRCIFDICMYVYCISNHTESCTSLVMHVFMSILLFSVCFHTVFFLLSILKTCKISTCPSEMPRIAFTKMYNCYTESVIRDFEHRFLSVVLVNLYFTCGTMHATNAIVFSLLWQSNGKLCAFWSHAKL